MRVQHGHHDCRCSVVLNAHIRSPLLHRGHLEVFRRRSLHRKLVLPLLQQGLEDKQIVVVLRLLLREVDQIPDSFVGFSTDDLASSLQVIVILKVVLDVESLVKVAIGARDERYHAERVEEGHEFDHVVALKQLIFNELQRQENLFIVIPFEQAALLLCQTLVNMPLHG